jgi:hypothetical protein
MTGRLPDRVPIVRTVNADTAFVQRYPDYAHWAIWTGRQHMEVLAPLTTL